MPHHRRQRCFPRQPATDPPAQGRYRHRAGLFRLHAARGSGISPPRVPDIRRGIPVPACNETRWSCPPTH
ncbi:hypothetical protein E6C72_20050 [Azospirillum sp. TSH100]|nr:hypothetical protein E6C72_20050 [Azospirillum sp. TSH100]